MHLIFYYGAKHNFYRDNNRLMTDNSDKPHIFAVPLAKSMNL